MHIKKLSFALITSAALLASTSCIAVLNDSQQLTLERAGRLIASTYVLGNPDEKLFGLRPEYSPARPSEMIHNDIEVIVLTEHSISETKEKPITIKGFKQFSNWLSDVRNNFRFRENLEVRTMGVCLDSCCKYPLDGGISHNSLYLTEACFVMKNDNPFLKSIKLLDGD